MVYLIIDKNSHNDAHWGQKNSERTKGDFQWRDRKYLKVPNRNHKAKTKMTIKIR